MTQLHSPARTITASHQTLYNHTRRTKTSPLTLLRQAHTWPSQPPTPHAPTLLRMPPQLLLSTSRATFSTTAQPRTASTSAPDYVIFAADQPSDLNERLQALFPAWRLMDSRKGITRQFTFSSFGKAWKFMSLVAEECKAKKHHPSWSNLYNQVTVEWTTHRPKGLSVKDVEMAEFCDRVADEVGLK
ncbi:transcriptional coactivator/pterin dehydratase [Decorospora gaudefroyi]|uniref:4a-hydroxytetrahydrobiopterin dehydratase n=1 Tax=Decorospora gaudefroyi TaxID=184978 RepID=A0A6A5K5J3_9PLEO|nr:transcriptional coactivator/pterin dehydratase [Decorospora gaudefroyi]